MPSRSAFMAALMGLQSVPGSDNRALRFTGNFWLSSIGGSGFYMPAANDYLRFKGRWRSSVGQPEACIWRLQSANGDLFSIYRQISGTLYLTIRDDAGAVLFAGAVGSVPDANFHEVDVIFGALRDGQSVLVVELDGAQTFSQPISGIFLSSSVLIIGNGGPVLSNWVGDMDFFQSWIGKARVINLTFNETAGPPLNYVGTNPQSMQYLGTFTVPSSVSIPVYPPLSAYTIQAPAIINADSPKLFDSEFTVDLPLRVAAMLRTRWVAENYNLYAAGFGAYTQETAQGVWFMFSGTQFEFKGLLHPNFSQYEVFVDGASRGFGDGRAAAPTAGTSYLSPVLLPGLHIGYTSKVAGQGLAFGVDEIHFY